MPFNEPVENHKLIAVDPFDHFTAVDHGSLDYTNCTSVASPSQTIIPRWQRNQHPSSVTLGHPQKCLRGSPPGSIINFHQVDLIKFSQLQTKNSDAAILIH
ncbi:hypothetical protein PROFUN_13058 [Planoprotostelium fungivorum]|uniref:Uncharacterized protein n=1 Tax=Planoprotostelium fungivorum TaxID=1890364 RepID=A0A2P6N5G5_9EUKA|nr:hypothetical protein PROFUN_13058 [Planoprotostelium fungivorum]